VPIDFDRSRVVFCKDGKVFAPKIQTLEAARFERQGVVLFLASRAPCFVVNRAVFDANFYSAFNMFSSF
jgi:hypothetical protein